MVADEVSKKMRFLDGLVETIALSLSGSDHPTYQSMDCLQGAPVRERLRGVVSALGLRVAEDPVGTDVVLAIVGSREVDTHRALDFDQ